MSKDKGKKMVLERENAILRTELKELKKKYDVVELELKQ